VTGKVNTLGSELAPSNELRREKNRPKKQGNAQPSNILLLLSLLQRSLGFFETETTNQDYSGAQEEHPGHHHGSPLVTCRKNDVDAGQGSEHHYDGRKDNPHRNAVGSRRKTTP
jgi:hypothetical protein